MLPDSVLAMMTTVGDFDSGWVLWGQTRGRGSVTDS